MTFSKVNTKQTVTKTVESVVLALTAEEAVVLRGLLQRVGGDPDDGPRKYTDNVEEELRRLGVPIPNNDKLFSPESDGKRIMLRRYDESPSTGLNEINDTVERWNSRLSS